MTTYSCVLCGRVDPDVKVALVHWEQPVGGVEYSAVPRCPERLACRLRVEEENHERWPLIDATRETWEATPERRTSFAPPAPADPTEPPPAGPPDEPPAEVVEDVAWL